MHSKSKNVGCSGNWPADMAYSEAPHQWAWLIMRDHSRRRGLWWDNTPEDMAYSEAPHQQARLIVRHYTRRYGKKRYTTPASLQGWVVKDGQAYWLSGKRSAGILSGNSPASTHLAHHSTSRHVWTAVVFVEVTLGQITYLLQRQRHSNGVSLDQQACMLHWQRSNSLAY